MNAPVKTVTLQIGDATITVPGEVAAMAYLERLLAESRPIALDFATPAVPPIGSEWKGGIYAGLSVHEEQPCALILLPDENPSCDWKEAGAWAEKQGGVLPSRFDQLVLFKNLKSEFKEAWYWSGEQYAGYSGYAWNQNFSYGDQSGNHKGYKGRCRAVRRLPIQ